MKKNKVKIPKVLIVGDASENVSFLKKVLIKSGFACIECETGNCIQEKISNEEVFLAVFAIETESNWELLHDRIDEVVNIELPHFILSNPKMYEKLDKAGKVHGTSDYLLKPVNESIFKSKVIAQKDFFERKQELKIAVDELEAKKQKIAEDQNKLKILTTAVSEPIIFVNQDVVVTFWNQEAQNMFGFSWYEAVSESFMHWMIAPKSHEQIKELFARVGETGARQLRRTQHFTMRNKLKVEIEVEATVSYHKLGNKEFNLVFVIHDKSKDKRLDKEIIRSRELKEENKLIKEFVKRIGLDIQTPLNVMLGITNTLKGYDADNLTVRQTEGLNIIEHSGNHLLELVNDLWDVSKLDGKKLKVNNEKFDFDKMLAWHKSQTYQLIKDKAIKLLFKKSPSIPTELNGDARKINQVLTELLANAVRYTEKGRIVLSCHLLENKLFFEITDTGKGIPANLVKNLKSLDKEKDTADIKTSGAELGLHIAHKLIELMKGELTIESEKLKGAVVRFYIPLQEKIKPVQTGIVESDEGTDVISYGYKKNTKLVLVVDDSLENKFFYQVLAEDDQYSVIQVKNGRKAPAAIHNFTPDLLIIKMEMPGIHGASIVRELRNKLIKIPVIAISQFKKLPNLASYNVQLISEPLSSDILINTIENRIRWFKKKSLKAVVVYEDASWLKAEKESDAIHYLNNKDPELSFIQITQMNPEYLIFENVEKTSNSLPLLLKVVSDLDLASFKEIYLQYEGVPMKYLVKKIESFPNIKLIAKHQMSELEELIQRI